MNFENPGVAPEIDCMDFKAPVFLSTENTVTVPVSSSMRYAKFPFEEKVKCLGPVPGADAANGVVAGDNLPVFLLKL